VKEEFLYFRISNPEPVLLENNEKSAKKGGIGLKNVRKRLALGYKKDQFDLDISNDNKLFIVNLKIKVK